MTLKARDRREEVHSGGMEHYGLGDSMAEKGVGKLVFGGILSVGNSREGRIAYVMDFGR